LIIFLWLFFTTFWTPKTPTISPHLYLSSTRQSDITWGSYPAGSLPFTSPSWGTFWVPKLCKWGNYLPQGQ
jgi:hypothetical protein